MSNFVTHCLVALAIISMPLIAAAAPVRGNLTLDDGTTVVVVDSTASGWQPGEIANLVLTADRSTKDDCMWLRATKGLFEAGDRVFVNYKYLAWLSASKGTLRGLWTLDAATRNFRHYRVGPEGCSWAHNELVPGSASPQGQLNLWDVYAPPVEHALTLIAPAGEWVGFNHESGLQTPTGNFQVIIDGVDSGEGVFYATQTRMAAHLPPTLGSTWTVDISDGNDTNGVQNWIDSQVGFIMRPDDIRVIWRLAPSTAINPGNLYYWLWFNYSFDIDGQWCDSNPANTFPDQLWGEPRYFQSSLVSWDGLNTSTDRAALEVVGELPKGTPCSHSNPGRYTHGVPSNGDWIRFGESNVLASGTRRLTLTHVVDSAWGVPIDWGYFGVANEDGDGVWGLGGQKFSPFSLSGGVWYSTSYVISTQ